MCNRVPMMSKLIKLVAEFDPEPVPPVPDFVRVVWVDNENKSVYVSVALATDENVSFTGVMFRAIAEEQTVIGVDGHNYVSAVWLAVAYPECAQSCNNIVDASLTAIRAMIADDTISVDQLRTGREYSFQHESSRGLCQVQGALHATTLWEGSMSYWFDLPNVGRVPFRAETMLGIREVS